MGIRSIITNKPTCYFCVSFSTFDKQKPAAAASVSISAGGCKLHAIFISTVYLCVILIVVVSHRYYTSQSAAANLLPIFNKFNVPIERVADSSTRLAMDTVRLQINPEIN